MEPPKKKCMLCALTLYLSLAVSLLTIVYVLLSRG